MCFFFQQSKDATTLQNRFKVKYSKDNIAPVGSFNGFSYPKTPIISNSNPEEIDLYSWGLIPHWAKDTEIRKFTLNARIETIKQKPSFRTSVKNRCLIIADTFFEWQWLDPKGKQKQKYELQIGEKESFAFGGLWSSWTNPETGEIINTYTILTTEANELMSQIHNSKKRMPVIVANEADWLMGDDLILLNNSIRAVAV
jgi:putative SOS response-associated peptidase YedK